MKQYVVAAIFARGGSKGVPRKNIRPLAGKPLIAYAIEAARASRLVDRVVVSTDDTEIADVARAHGAEVPFLRPAELAQDSTSEWLAWQHALRALAGAPGQPAPAIDVLVSVPPTAPLRSAADIDACIEKLTGGDADIVITVKPAERNPYFNMVVLDDQQTARRAIVPDRPILRRQDARTVYDMTTVAYAARPSYVLRSSGVFDGKVQAVVIPAERALDIDTELDFAYAEFLMRRGQ